MTGASALAALGTTLRRAASLWRLRLGLRRVGLLHGLLDLLRLLHALLDLTAGGIGKSAQDPVPWAQTAKGAPQRVLAGSSADVGLLVAALLDDLQRRADDRARLRDLVRAALAARSLRRRVLLVCLAVQRGPRQLGGLQLVAKETLALGVQEQENLRAQASALSERPRTPR